MGVAFDQKEEIRQATDLIHVVGEVVALKPKGREFVGLCPFHDDKSPSMFVSPAKQIYKCFSCGASGDVFGFMMNYHKMTFIEALKHLAERSGIKLRETQRGRGNEANNDQPTDREIIGRANQQAMAFFKVLLKSDQHGQIAREYVAKRGISSEMMELFQIGYAPDRWDGLATMIADKRWNRRGFELAGLVSARQGGDGFYDRLRHRLIFPILDALGRPIAFGGRKLREEDEPKYLNSPETLLFNKSGTLYGIHAAKKPIIDSRVAVIVEGYTDVIACHQHGAANVVATLGTALTTEHIGVLRRFADKVVLVFDGDTAGQKAADRAVELFISGEMDVAIAILPDGEDPDTLISAADGLNRWNAIIGAATEALTYQFARVREQLDAATTMTARQRVAEDYIRRLADMGLGHSHVIRRAMIVQQLSDLLHLSESAINDLLQQARPRPARRPFVSHSPEPPPAGDGSPNAPSRGRPPAAPPTPGAHASERMNRGTGEVFEFSHSISDDFGDNMLPDAAYDAEADSNPGLDGDNLPADFEPPLSASKMRAWQVAERQLLGALIHRPDLTHDILDDGRSLDDAVASGDLATAQGGLLYERLLDAFSQDRPFKLAAFLGDLAEEGRQDLGNFATLCESEVEHKLVGQRHTDELIRLIAHDSARYLRTHANQRDYQRQKQVWLQSPVAAVDAQAPASTDSSLKALLRAREHNRAHASRKTIKTFTPEPRPPAG